MKNRLNVTTPSDTEIVMTRDFDAPRQMVWDTMTKPELLKRWLFGPPGWIMTVCDDDQKVGGEFRWAWRGPGGEELTMRGVNLEFSPPERGVRTEIFEMVGGPPMGEQHATLVLVERSGKTSLTLTLVYATKQARDGAIASGMEGGVAAGYDRLDEILAE